MNNIVGYTKLLLLILVITYNPAIVSAENSEVYSWVTPTWKGYTEEDNTGLYSELINAIAKIENIVIIKQIAPWERSLKMVNSGRAEMTGALYYSDVRNQSKYPVSESDEGILYKAEALHNIEGVDALKKYNGVWVNGFFSYSFRQNKYILKGVGVLTRKQAMQMLLTDNREIDYYFDSREQIIQVAEQLNINIDSKDLYFKNFSKVPLYMTFSNTSKGKILKSFFDSGIEQLFCQNKLNAIYEKWHKTPPTIYITCEQHN